MSYAVNRGIGAKGQEGDTHAEGLARLLNAEYPWPTSLVERSKRCAHVVHQAKTMGYTKKLEASAVTKFSWFAQPASWTVYDSLAARAMRIEGTSADGCMLNFYRRLAERRFAEVAKEIQQVLDEHPWIDLHGTRVLDKLMMLRGAKPKWRENTLTRCRDFSTSCLILGGKRLKKSPIAQVKPSSLPLASMKTRPVGANPGIGWGLRQFPLSPACRHCGVPP